MPAAAAARVIPWVEELLNFGHDTLVFSSKSVSENNGRVLRSFFVTPSNKSSLGKRLFQEVLLGIDLGIKIWKNRKSCKSCFITSPPFFMAFICALFCKFSKVPFIFDVRDRYPKVLADLDAINESTLIFKFLSFVECWIYRNATQITTVTEGLKDELKVQFPDLNICLLRNGFDENLFTDDLLSLPKRANFTVVYHGRLGRFYDEAVYLDIMQLVHQLDSSIRFLMIGDFPKDFSSKRPKNLEFLPAVPLQDLSKLLNSCHLGICFLRELPAMKNAFPAKAYDYIGAGLSILAGPSGELTDMVDKMGIGVTFAKICPQSVAHKIVEMKNNQLLRSKMSTAVKKNRMNFGRRKIAKTYFANEFLFSVK